MNNDTAVRGQGNFGTYCLTALPCRGTGVDISGVSFVRTVCFGIVFLWELKYFMS